MNAPPLSPRARAIFYESLGALQRQTDRLFAVLMMIQFAFGVLAALFISPLTWSGVDSSTHPHVLASIVVGGLIASVPIALATWAPGQPLTRMVIATGQMLASALLIHIAGGRIETHFHVFGSLALLAFYRDWRVLVVATVVIGVDHVARGVLWPESVFGVLTPAPWRALEHLGWVLLEVAFLAYMCFKSNLEMQCLASTQAQLEQAKVETEAQVAERTTELREINERFNRAVRGTTDGLWDWEVHTGKVWFAPRFKEMLGFDETAFPDDFEAWERRLHPDDRERTMRAIERHLVEREPYDVEYRLLTRSGVYRRFRARGRAYRDAAGEPVRMSGSIQDVTETRQMVDELARQARELRMTQFSLDHCPDAVFWITPQGRFIYANQTACAMLGYSLEEMEGMSVADVNPDVAPENWPQLWAQLSESKSRTFEARYRRKDGEIIPVEITANYLEYEGRCYGCSIVRDVTDRKRMEEAQQRQKQMKQTLKSMERVIAVMGHELRTPLAALRASSELLVTAGDAPNADLSELTSIIHDEAVRMSEMVNNMLEATRLNSGAAKWQWTTVDVNEVVDSALYVVRPLVDKQRVAMELDIQPDLHIAGDSDAIRRLIINLVSNAAKNTQEGYIRISISEAFENGVRWARVVVEDSGGGIPENILHKLGEAFVLNSGSLGADYIKGAGLGLSVCKGIVAAHGGRITVQSKEGHGATFTATIRANLPGPDEREQHRCIERATA